MCIVAADILANLIEGCHRHRHFDLSLLEQQVILSHIATYKESMELLMIETSPTAFDSLYDELRSSEMWFERFLSANGQLDDADEVGRRVASWSEAKFGPEDERTLTSFHNLAVIFYKQGKYDKVEELNRRVLSGRTKVLGAEHVDTLKSLNKSCSCAPAPRKVRGSRGNASPGTSDLRTCAWARGSRDTHET